MWRGGPHGAGLGCALARCCVLGLFRAAESAVPLAGRRVPRLRKFARPWPLSRPETGCGCPGSSGRMGLRAAASARRGGRGPPAGVARPDLGASRGAGVGAGSDL